VLVDLPPSVTITNPVSGTNVTLPADILVAASASDGDGTISQVDFYAGAIWIGAAQSAPYSVTWSNAPAGVFALTAVATDNLGVTTTSAIVYVTNNVFSPSSLSGLRLWLDAGAGVTTNGAAQISLWADQSGRTNNALQGTLSNQPLLVTNALNGRPVVRFDGTNDQFGFQNNPFLGATQGEMFIVVKARVDSPGVHRALAFFGASDFTYYPHDSGQIYDQFGSTVIKALGDPGQPLDQFGIYSSSAAPKDWSARLNGVLLYRTTNNTVGFASTPLLGTGNGTSYFDGDVAELLIYNRTLTAAERDAVGGYLAGKFALASAPVAPTNLTAKAISSNQVSLAWSGVVTNQLTKYVVERKQGTNGTYASIAEVENGLSYLDTGLAGGTQYFYRVKARNYAGESGYSNEADATTVAGVTAMPITELVLWLKADAGARGRKSERLGGPVRKGQQCGAGERCGSASCGGWGGEWASGNPV
jgi:hypothetical protein